MKPRIGLLLAALIAASLPALAHHSTAAYFDTSRTISVTGVITKVNWINPHVVIFVNSRNDKGEVEVWALHSLAPKALLQVTPREKFKEGLTITVACHPAKAGISAPSVASSINASDGVGIRICEAGEGHFASGEKALFGRGPGFDGLPVKRPQ